MRHRYFNYSDKMEHHPRLGIGLFFILLGIALLIATTDLLHLGGISNYFTWETAMIFVGMLLLLNLQFTGGLLLIAGGVWFLIENNTIELPGIIRTIYWPAIIILIGLSFILTSFFNRKIK